MATQSHIHLISGATDVELPVPAPGRRCTPRTPSQGLQTGDGHYGYVLGDAWWEIEFELPHLTSTQARNLEDFWTTTVQGMANAFTLTWYDEATHTARFLEEPEIEVRSSGSYSARLRLRCSTRVL